MKKTATLFGFFALILLSTCSTHAQRAPTAEVEVKDQSIEERLRPGVKTRLDLGLGWGFETVIRENGRTTVFSEGKRTLEPIRPLGEHDRLAIGSVSKTFTGILIHLAEAEGRLKTDQTLAAFFPDLKGRDAGAITLFDLGLHQSGLSLSVPGTGEYVDIKKSDVLAALKNWKAPDHPAGKPVYDRVYSNWGFMTLGLVLEKVYGRSYPELVRAKIFTPLSMRETAVDSVKILRPSSRKHPRPSKNPLSGYSLAGDLLPWWHFPGFLAATGGIESNAIDMAKLIQALETPPAGNLGRAISLSMDSGIGWDSEPGSLLNWKNGSTAANSAILIFDRAKKRGLFIGTNTDFDPDHLGFYASGKTATDAWVSALVTKRVAPAEEFAILRGGFRSIAAIPGEAIARLEIFESFGHFVARTIVGPVVQGATFFPGADAGLWNVASPGSDLVQVKILESGPKAKLRFTVKDTLTGKVTTADFIKEETKLEAYPAQE